MNGHTSPPAVQVRCLDAEKTPVTGKFDAAPEIPEIEVNAGRRSVLAVIGVLLSVISAAWATSLADRSGSWTPACYEENICDSLTFTVAGELLREGLTPYEEQVRRDHISRTRLSGEIPPFDLPFQYPPNALPLFALRSLASPRLAHTGTAVLGTFVFLLLFSRLAGRWLSDTRAEALLVLSVAMSATVAFNAELGQTGVLAAALVSGIALCWKQSPVGAGILLGLLAFKPQYAAAILLLALVRREPRIVIGAGGAFGVMTVISGALFGFGQWAAFLAAAAEPNHTVPWMVNWMGLAWQVAPDGLDVIQHAALPVFVVSQLALGAVLWSLRDRTSVEGQLSIALVWTVLASPNTHPYDLLVMAPALIYASHRVRRGRMGVLFSLLTWLTLPQPLRWALVLAVAGFCGWLLRREARVDRSPLWKLDSSPSSTV